MHPLQLSIFLGTGEIQYLYQLRPEFIFFPFMDIQLSLSPYVLICSVSRLVCPFLQSGAEELSFLYYFKCLITQIGSFGLGFEWPGFSFLNSVFTKKTRGKAENQGSWEADIPVISQITSGKPYSVQLSSYLKITDSYNKNS